METISITDAHGNFQAEATRDSVREPWTIRYEDGEERFHGSEAQVRARITKRLRQASSTTT